MRSWMRMLFVAAAMLMAAPFAMAPAPAYAQANASITGMWQGVYFGGGNQRTEFTATFRESNGRLSGTIVEPNQFGTPNVSFLVANLSGTIRNGRIRFTKTYDGTGGQTHAVTYEGRFESDGHRIVGTWSIGQLSGQFEMAR